jgi:hypothetical protein
MHPGQQTPGFPLKQPMTHAFGSCDEAIASNL